MPHHPESADGKQKPETACIQAEGYPNAAYGRGSGMLTAAEIVQLKSESLGWG